MTKYRIIARHLLRKVDEPGILNLSNALVVAQDGGLVRVDQTDHPAESETVDGPAHDASLLCKELHGDEGGHALNLAQQVQVKVAHHTILVDDQEGQAPVCIPLDRLLECR